MLNISQCSSEEEKICEQEFLPDPTLLCIITDKTELARLYENKIAGHTTTGRRDSSRDSRSSEHNSLILPIQAFIVAERLGILDRRLSETKSELKPHLQGQLLLEVAVYQTLHSKGFWILPGTKFASDYLAYAQPPSEAHSLYTVTIHANSSWSYLNNQLNQQSRNNDSRIAPINLRTLVASSRLCTQVDKKLLLAFVDETVIDDEEIQQQLLQQQSSSSSTQQFQQLPNVDFIEVSWLGVTVHSLQRKDAPASRTDKKCNV
ncbi:MAG: hypothetical protein EZS28_025284 [Streblomastix strix]|uniref:tRNA-intron lyase n=1 Tax=Streblomastix strix TaxID=222440 RepID=A0A5J4V9F1_9EUKA|nr:MAG: hypothetical protein EZS28_025284 [Streblomastix strix]